MKRFDFLDNYRGLMALSVLLTHAGIAQYSLLSGHLFGVICFFLLSSFLLTYQMIDQFKSKINVMEALKLTIVYFIRRFFRIYIPYVFVMLVYKFLVDRTFIFREKDLDGKFWKALQLQVIYHTGYIGFNWTIPLEVRFYLVIPIISMVASLASRKDAWLAVLLFFLTGIIFVIPYFEDSQISLIHWYRTFVMGSMIAIIYKRFENISLENYKSFINYATIVMFIIGSQLPCVSFFEIKDSRSKILFYSIFWASHLLLMLSNENNSFNIYLKKAAFLRTLGNFSFGIYLLHMLAIRLVQYAVPDFKTVNQFHLMFAYTSLAFLFSYVFYHLIELKSMHISSKASSW